MAAESSHLQIGVTQESITYNVTATYYTIQVLIDNRNRLEQNILNLESIIKVNEVLLTNEIIAANVHYRLNINLQNLKNEYENLQINLSNQYSSLKYLMNITSADSLVVMPFENNVNGKNVQLYDLRMRPDMRLQHSLVKLEELKMKSVMARYKPTMTLSLTSGFTSYNDALAPYEQINNDWIGNSAVSVQAKIPLFAGFQKKFQMGQQHMSIQQAKNSYALMQLRAEKEVWEANANFDRHQDQLLNTKKSLDMAQQLFDSAQEDYVQGLNTISDLLNAQNDLTDARSNYSTALLNLKLTELAIRKANGLL